MNINEIIKQKRKELGLSRAQLAKKINRSIWYIGRVERGGVNIKIADLMKFDEVLHIKDEVWS